MPNSRPSPKCLYVVHGWTYTLKPWSDLVDALKAEGIEVKLLKVPGLTKKSRKVWTISAYVRWLERELASIRRPVVIGHSNGGRLLLNYCLAHPRKLRHLILLNSAGIPPSTTAQLRTRILAVLAKLAGPLRKISLLRRVVYRLLGSGDYNLAPANMKKTLANMLDSDHELLPRLAEIKTSVSLIWGEDDRVTPLSQGVQLRDSLPGIPSLEVLPETGHAPYVSCPLRLKQAILKILKDL